jgi:3-hydroxy-9,10-secoandrosta-1,3,5(10)-triene-9,17-dione monooxygenase
MKDVFVPERRQRPMFSASPPPPEGAVPLYKVPHAIISLDPLVAAAHGMAQGVLDQFIERTKARVGTFDRSKYSENPDIHRYIAETDYAIRAARALSHINQQAAFDAAVEGRELPMIEKARYFWEGAKSVHCCTEVASRLFSISGAHTIFAGDSLQRALRDLQTATTHIGFNFNANGRNYGAMHMGHPNTLYTI